MSEQRITAAAAPHLADIFSIYDGAERELLRILIEMENELAGSVAQMPLITSESPLAVRLAAMEDTLALYRTNIDAVLFDRGSRGLAWIDDWASRSTLAGIERMQVTLDAAEAIQGVNVRPMRAAFQNFSRANANELVRVNRDILIRNLDGTAEDMMRFFRREFTRGIAQGIPSVGPGDTIATRLFESGRIKDLKTASGRIIKAETRAQTIAMTELSRIHNQAYLEESRAIGLNEFLFVGPLDDKTDDICVRALNFAGEDAKTAEEYEAAGFNLGPQHINCRHGVVAWDDSWGAVPS